MSDLPYTEIERIYYEKDIERSKLLAAINDVAVAIATEPPSPTLKRLEQLLPAWQAQLTELETDLKALEVGFLRDKAARLKK